jgi:thiosulfate dehydrogenase [quinone] large subunit
MNAPTTHPVHPELADLPTPARIEAETQAYAARYPLAVARIFLGWTFLWAFLDKTFGLGFATPAENAWINGGSPATGFLQFGTEGKLFHEFFAGLASPAADWLFMAGLLGIGLALTLGIGMRIAAAAGTVLLTSMWAASLRLENNPFMDDHIISAVVLIALATFGAGRTLGLGQLWERLPFVQRHPILK